MGSSEKGPQLVYLETHRYQLCGTTPMNTPVSNRKPLDMLLLWLMLLWLLLVVSDVVVLVCCCILVVAVVFGHQVETIARAT